MQQADVHYPQEPCPFCNIASAFPFPETSSTTPASLGSVLWNEGRTTKAVSAATSTRIKGESVAREEQQDEDEGEGEGGGESEEDTLADLLASIPSDEESDCEKTNPSSFVVLRSRGVVAFLDILPMTGGHLLVSTRNHKVKLADMNLAESREIGQWLPLLARTVSLVTGVSDYNIVQNNGARAAQVVPHVHFHIIPRPESMPRIQSKSWTMFGRGKRGDLDEEEGARMAGEMRRALRGVVGGRGARL